MSTKISLIDKLDKMDEKLDKIIAMLEGKTADWILEQSCDIKTQKQEFDNTKIVWTTHNNVKYKTCKYKCGNYVSWDDNTKKYLHYDAEFKLIGADCPKFGGS